MPFPKQYFFGTHAAIGGTPWREAVNPWTGQPNETIWEFPSGIETAVTLEQDRAAAAVVASWTFPQIISAFQRCQERLKTPAEDPHVDPQPGNPYRPQPGGPYRPQPGIGTRIHVVKAGDWLSKIAITYYGDMNKWKVIYDHPQNRRTIGPNPDLIQPGQRLIIP
jgi:nucleoid-associated protein YgaU